MDLQTGEIRDENGNIIRHRPRENQGAGHKVSIGTAVAEHPLTYCSFPAQSHGPTPK